MPESVTDRPTKAHSYVFLLTKRARYYYDADAIRDEYRYDGRRAERWPGAGANARTVWTIATEPTPFAHFATFPQALVERCIKAGTSEHGACGVCGAPWQRVVERAKAAGSLPAREGGHPNGSRDVKGGGPAYVKWKLANPDVLKGWAPTCDHAAATVRPCVVLDPFMGSGTTALVARRLGRRSVGVELSAAYGAIAARRLQQLSLFSEQAPA
jgi:hypothetical protein